MTEVPLYGKVEEVLASEIARGDMRPGDRLPSEDELLTRFAVSRITVRRAIQNLVQRGIVEIQRGRGTFVLAPKVSQELTKLTGFVEDMDTHGRKASARVVSQQVVVATPRVAQQLGISKGTRVMRIERVRLADAVPMSFDETYLPLDIGRKIVRNNLRVMPIFTLLEEKYGIPLTDAEYSLEAAAASAQVAEALEVPEGAPIFRIERMHFQRGHKHQESRTNKGVIFVVIAQHMADILTKKTFDTFPKFLNPIDICLRHPPGPIRRIRWPRIKLLDLLLYFEIPRNVSRQIANQRKRFHRLDRDRFFQRQFIQPRHTHQFRPAINLR